MMKKSRFQRRQGHVCCFQFCAEVVISVDGRAVCADDPEEAIPISFCQSLGYSTSDGSLNPTA